MTLIAVIVSSEGAFLFSDTLISIGESNPTRSLPKLSVHNDLLANKVQVFGNTVVGYSGIVSSIINAAEAVETRFNAGKDFKPTPRAISEIVQDTSFGKPDNEHVNCLSLQINKLASTDLSIGFSAYGKVVQEVIAEGWAVISIGSGAREFATEAQDHAKEIAYTGVKPTDSVFAQHMSVGLVGRLNGEFITGGYTYPRNAWGGLLENLVF